MVFSNEVHSTFTAMSSRNLFSDQVNVKSLIHNLTSVVIEHQFVMLHPLKDALKL